MWSPSRPPDDPADFIVDVAHAEIVSGNEAARRLFLGSAGQDQADRMIHGTGFDLSLDRAMPALMTLGRVAGARREVPCTLVLWTAGGVERIEAMCAPVSSPFGTTCVRVTERGPDDPPFGNDWRHRLNGRAGPDPTVAPTHAPASGALQDDAGLRRANGEANSVGSEHPVAAPCDATTLAVIAQRIRQGLPASPPRASNAEPPAPLSFGSRAEVAAAVAPADARADQALSPPAGPRRLANASVPAVIPSPAAALSSTDVRLARLAHEIRTPLAAVAALAEIMRDQQLGPLANARYRGYASDIFESATHALALLEDVLDDGAEGRKPVGPRAALDANKVIANAVSAMEPFADRAGVMLVAELRPRLPSPAIEQRALTQVLFNLLTNAFNHSLRGGRITVAAEARGGDGWLTIVVQDTGRGMSEAVIRSAEARPVAAGRAGSSPSGSTGFGLPIVRDLVTAADGTLVIESEVGHGTRITLALPPWRPT